MRQLQRDDIAQLLGSSFEAAERLLHFSHLRVSFCSESRQTCTDMPPSAKTKPTMKALIGVGVSRKISFRGPGTSGVRLCRDPMIERNARSNEQTVSGEGRKSPAVLPANPRE